MNEYFTRRDTGIFIDDVMQMRRKHLERKTKSDDWCSKREILHAHVWRIQEMVQEVDEIVQSTTEFMVLRHLVSLHFDFLDLQRKQKIHNDEVKLKAKRKNSYTDDFFHWS